MSRTPRARQEECFALHTRILLQLLSFLKNYYYLIVLVGVGVILLPRATRWCSGCYCSSSLTARRLWI